MTAQHVVDRKILADAGSRFNVFANAGLASDPETAAGIIRKQRFCSILQGLKENRKSAAMAPTCSQPVT